MGIFYVATYGILFVLVCLIIANCVEAVKEYYYSFKMPPKIREFADSAIYDAKENFRKWSDKNIILGDDHRILVATSHDQVNISESMIINGTKRTVVISRIKLTGDYCKYAAVICDEIIKYRTDQLSSEYGKTISVLYHADDTGNTPAGKEKSKNVDLAADDYVTFDDLLSDGEIARSGSKGYHNKP